MRIPILDNHVHLHPNGRHVEAVKEFQRAGGTHLILSHLPYEDVVISSEKDFEASYQITLQLAERCRAETEVGVEVTLGPYPVLLLDLERKLGLQRAIEVMKGGMEIAQRFVLEDKAIGIGEVGRPHFPVPPEILEASNDILVYGMGLAREADCPIVLHTESATPESMKELASFADKAGLRRERVVKHYCPPLVREEENHGLFPSILASRTATREALSKGSRFLLETDYLDDMQRPGAVMAIITVPKRTRALLQSGEMTSEIAYKVHKENPKLVYGIDVRE